MVANVYLKLSVVYVEDTLSVIALTVTGDKAQIYVASGLFVETVKDHLKL